MATPEENLAAMQALYASTIAALTAAMASTAPNITVDGISVDRMGYIRELRQTLVDLAKIPGVAQLEIFNVTSVAR